jgi:hypothetical protein
VSAPCWIDVDFLIGAVLQTALFLTVVVLVGTAHDNKRR